MRRGDLEEGAELLSFDLIAVLDLPHILPFDPIRKEPQLLVLHLCIMLGHFFRREPYLRLEPFAEAVELIFIDITGAIGIELPINLRDAGARRG